MKSLGSDSGFAQTSENILMRYKGGPGSGHHGHAGRPGQRGGSAPSGALGIGGLEDSPASYEWLQGAVSGLMSERDQQYVEVLVEQLREKVPESSFQDLTAVRVGAPDTYEFGVNRDGLIVNVRGDTCSGLYQNSTRTIFIAPRAVRMNTVLHELGHHVTRKTGDSADLSLIRLRKHLAGRGKPLSDYGLRNYSLRNNRDILADAFVAKYSDPGKYEVLRGVAEDIGVDLDVYYQGG